MPESEMPCCEAFHSPWLWVRLQVSRGEHRFVPYLRGGEMGLGRFELPSQALLPHRGGPKARRIDQATPQPQIPRASACAMNTLSHVRAGDFRKADQASRAAARMADSLD